MDRLPAGTLPGVMLYLTALMARVAARLAAVSDDTPKPDGNGAGRPDAEWLTAGEVAVWLGYSERTIRRYMHDGTWRKGEQWFRHAGSRPRFSRSGLQAWLQAPDKPAPVVGLAYGPDIPRGRRRRLPSLRNKAMTAHLGAKAGAEADGAAGGVSGASAANGAARID